MMFRTKTCAERLMRRTDLCEAFKLPASEADPVFVQFSATRRRARDPYVLDEKHMWRTLHRWLSSVPNIVRISRSVSDVKAHYRCRIGFSWAVRAFRRFFLRDFLFSDIGATNTSACRTFPTTLRLRSPPLESVRRTPRAVAGEIRTDRDPVGLPVGESERASEQARRQSARRRSGRSPTHLGSPRRRRLHRRDDDDHRPQASGIVSRRSDWTQLALVGAMTTCLFLEIAVFSESSSFNIAWHERPKRGITSFVKPKGCSDEARYAQQRRLPQQGVEGHHLGRARAKSPASRQAQRCVFSTRKSDQL